MRTFQEFLAYYTAAIPDLIVIQHYKEADYISFNAYDPETPAFLRKGFGLKLPLEAVQ